MNKFESEKRFVERMKRCYPPGTRITLLSMGDDPRPVEDNTRGTVRVVDDIGTLHCVFDNDRSLGIVPSEDSFRKLTDEELAKEQNENIDEENAPVMFDFSRIHSMAQRYEAGKEFKELLIGNYDLYEREKKKPEQLNLFRENYDYEKILKECIIQCKIQK